MRSKVLIRVADQLIHMLAVACLLDLLDLGLEHLDLAGDHDDLLRHQGVEAARRGAVHGGSTLNLHGAQEVPRGLVLCLERVHGLLGAVKGALHVHREVLGCRLLPPAHLVNGAAEGVELPAKSLQRRP